MAILCSEHDPLRCHRTLLVARELDRRSVPVAHILRNGTLMTHPEGVRRTMKMNGAHPQSGEDPGEEGDRALDLQAARVAFRRGR